MNLVWVDAPDPLFCGFKRIVGDALCCLNGFFDPPYQRRSFKTDDQRKAANISFLKEFKAKQHPFYKGKYPHRKPRAN